MPLQNITLSLYTDIDLPRHAATKHHSLSVHRYRPAPSCRYKTSLSLCTQISTCPVMPLQNITLSLYTDIDLPRHAATKHHSLSVHRYRPAPSCRYKTSLSLCTQISTCPVMPLQNITLSLYTDIDLPRHAATKHHSLSVYIIRSG